MLRLFTGRAGTGKTAAVINEIHTAVLEKQGRRLLIVPEQYSHEAERELCRVCGDSMSLYAEVMSFTGLARRIASQQGGGAAPYLDKGGRLLCMALALDGAASRLRVYGSAGRRAETQSALLAAVDSLDGQPIVPAQVDELRRSGTAAEYRVVIHQGKKRQIRRMCAAVGLEVTRLCRVAEGGLSLGELPPGKWRYLTAGELRTIKGSDRHE